MNMHDAFVDAKEQPSKPGECDLVFEKNNVFTCAIVINDV